MRLFNGQELAHHRRVSNALCLGRRWRFSDVLIGRSGRFLFDITASNELLPSAALDFEAPSDDDENNVYEIVIAVSDGNASDDEALSITIQDALEGRVVDGPVSGAGVVVAGESGSVVDAVETDDEGFWLIPEEIDTQSLQVKSTGGVDTATGKELWISF